MPQSRTACPSGNALAPYFCVVLESNSKQSGRDRKSTRLNSSHGYISYAVFCLKKKHREVLGVGELGEDLRVAGGLDAGRGQRLRVDGRRHDGVDVPGLAQVDGALDVLVGRATG